MKKIICLIICLLLFTGCNDKVKENEKQKLENSTISCKYVEQNETNTKEWGYEFNYDEYGEKLLSIQRRVTIYLTNETDDVEVANWLLASNNICNDIEKEGITCDVVSTIEKIERVITVDMTKEISADIFDKTLELTKSDFQNKKYEELKTILLNDENYTCN